MKAGPRVNLGLEAVSGCLFLLFVLLVGLMGLLAANLVALELCAVADPMSVTDRILFSPRGYLTSLTLLLIPSAIIGLAILGIRILLVHPEPPPWMDEQEEDSFGVPP